MERKIKRKKKVKQQDRKMRKIHKKYSLVAHVQLWLERHSKIASFMDGGIILLSIFGIMLCVVRDVTYPETVSRNVLCLANYYEFCLFGAHTLSRYF